MMKLRRAICLGAVFSALTAGTAFAGTWVKGQEPNQDKWQYANGDGTCARDGWQWIDGNNDGTAEYYYFDSEGWMLSDTITPDGNRVNADGAWVIDGAVQTQQVHTVSDTTAAGTAADTAARTPALWMWTENADGTRVMNQTLMYEDIGDYFRFMSSFDGQEFPYHSTQETVAGWAQVSERGAAWKALFDQYAIPYDICGENPYRAESVAFTSAPGKSADEQYSVTGAVQMMIWVLTDGMSQAEFYTTISGDGAITVTASLKMFG